MNKVEIVRAVVNATGVDFPVAEKVIDAFITRLKHTLIDNEHLEIRGFGTFKNIVRAEKKGRNIVKNKEIIIPECLVPKFKPCKSFKTKINAKRKN